MRKILIVLPSVSQTNGVARFITNYLSNMDLKNLDITILTTNYNVSEIYVDMFEKMQIPIFYIKNAGSDGFFKYYASLKKFFKNNHDFDTIYSNVANQSFFVFNLAKKYGINRFILHSHATKSADSFMKRLRNNFLIKKAIKKTNIRLACSHLAGISMFKKSDFIVINNALEIEKFKYNIDTRKNLRSQFNFKNSDIILGFVGRFTKQKNIFFLIEILNKLPHIFKLLMIGNGPQKKELLKKIAHYSLEQRVFIVNETYNVNEYYNVMDIFLLPSLYEGLPVVGIEAQCNGLPCLFSSTITKEASVSHKVLYIDIKNVDMWVKNIKTQTRDNIFDFDSSYDIQVASKKLENILNNG